MFKTPRKVVHMSFPTFRLKGLETLDGFQEVILKSYDNFQLTFEIFGSPSFIKRAQAQLLLGSTTATLDSKPVRLHGIHSSTGPDPKKAMIFSGFYYRDSDCEP